MKVTYLGHSGFLVETEKAYYLFDYIRGKLLELTTGKPLYVFASHSHADHFCTEIFEENVKKYVTAYILSSDILKKNEKSHPQWLNDNENRIFWIKPRESLTFSDCKVTTLKSTDIGVAFIVEEENLTIYHAGDLNWWHWEGEDKADNRNMEVNYKREIDTLKGRKINLAFVPLDPRQEEAYWYGMGYFTETVDADVVFPMHFWEDYTVIDRYIKEHGNGKNIVKIEREEQRYEI